ncbi:MAG: hypothetical protein ABI969_06415 [bacterium]
MAEVGRPTKGAMLCEATRVRDWRLSASVNDAESMKSIAFADPLSDCGVASVEAAELLMQGTEKAREASAAIAGGVSEGIPKCRRGR